MTCQLCTNSPARLLKPSTQEKVCIPCFISSFEQTIHETILSTRMFKPQEKVAICVSGGKDSTVLAHVLCKLNKKYNYNLNLFLLSIDEGIKGYRDDSLEIVKQNQKDYQCPLTILSYKDLYGLSMDDVMVNKNNKKKNSCSYCGVFRRKALEIGAQKLNCRKMVLGHNADDLAETILLNFMRGDIEKLQNCATDFSEIENTKLDDAEIENRDNGNKIENINKVIRLKPLKYAYEKEIVLYAHYLNLKYFSTECTYAPQSTRQICRNYIKKLERINPSFILNIIKYAEGIQKKPKEKKFNNCIKCQSLTPNEICKACLFVEDLNKK